ncbi:MAG: hypothetical protein CMJ80_02140 [Planctomycetaceae bacterium]|nr:hypothetical protein [Planctomycetaceae bacterium]
MPNSFSRRDLLSYSSVSLSGLGLGSLLRHPTFGNDAQGTSSATRIKACIFIFQYGGPSHLDTFDMKPDATRDIRGEFEPISSSVPGLPVCEHLPQLSKRMHQVALIRSMHHTNRLHDSASTEVLTGYPSPTGDRENFSPTSQFYPSFGGAMSHLWNHKKLDIVHAALPWVFHNVVNVPCQGGGFLGHQFDPFQIVADPVSVSYRAKMLEKPIDLTFDRIEQRLDLLSKVELGVSTRQLPQQVKEWRRLHERSVDLLSAHQLRTALRIDLEDSRTREKYGLYKVPSTASGVGAQNAYGQNLRGQNLLLARRLVEAGVPFVNVYDYKQQGQNWDAHADNFRQHKDHLLPAADRGIAALIEDLNERGLLESTLIVSTGEFGRTPRINRQGGRDHWPDCYTVLLAGGGSKGGFVLGASDPNGAYPIEAPVSPADLSATIYWRFGIDPGSEIYDATGRPHRLSSGSPIRALFM